MANRVVGLYGDWGLSFRDAGNEIGTVGGTARAVFGADDDSNVGAQQALWDAFWAAVDAITLGTLEKRSYFNVRETAVVTPTNGAARELKLLTIYECTATGKRYRLTIPTLDPTIPEYINNVSVKDAVVLDSPSTITDYITAFNAFVVAPDIPASVVDGTYATNPACTVIGLRVVGRNN